MTANDALWALAGGGVIGLASAALMLFDGRVMGVSGILGAFVSSHARDRAWRGFLLGGMLLCGLLMSHFMPTPFDPMSPRPLLMVAVSGALVGYGTRLGSGCTSGHGICGIGRLSIRSIVATGVFVAVGALTATLVRAILGSGT